MNSLTPSAVSTSTWNVRHFQVETVGMIAAKEGADWTVYTATDTRELPSTHKDKLREYAIREEASRWHIVNKQNRNHYHVRAVEDYLACDCPAGVRPPRASTTTAVDPVHGSCVHRDIVAVHQAIQRETQAQAAEAQAAEKPKRKPRTKRAPKAAGPLPCALCCSILVTNPGQLCATCLAEVRDLNTFAETRHQNPVELLKQLTPA